MIVVEKPLLEIEDLPHLAEPIVGFIDENRPDIVVGCDRGARLFSLAVHTMWHELHPDERFPTFDGSIHFTKASSNYSGRLHLKNYLAALFETFDKKTKSEVPEPHVLFLDDWIDKGRLKRTLQKGVEKTRPNSTVSFGTMIGVKGDVIGESVPNKLYEKPLHDDSEQIGVYYRLDGDAELKVYPTRTLAAKRNRDLLHAACHNFVSLRARE